MAAPHGSELFQNHLCSKATFGALSRKRRDLRQLSQRGGSSASRLGPILSTARLALPLYSVEGVEASCMGPAPSLRCVSVWPQVPDAQSQDAGPNRFVIWHDHSVQNDKDLEPRFIGTKRETTLRRPEQYAIYRSGCVGRSSATTFEVSIPCRVFRQSRHSR